VLESVGGNQDRAIDALLVMSDPEYKGEPPATVQPEQPALVRSICASSDALFLTALQSQTELDEQFARHLMLEEQQHRQQQWVNANPRPPATYQSHPSQRRWNSQAQPGEGGAVAESSMGDFQEQFSKIAESQLLYYSWARGPLLTSIQVVKRPLGVYSPKSKRRSKNLTKTGEGLLVFSFHYSPRCPRSTGQTSSSSTQPTWNANTAYSAHANAQSAAVTQPSYFDPNPHSPVPTPLVAHQSPPATTPALKGYDLSPSPSPSKSCTFRMDCIYFCVPHGL
jgi:hypothetical protein